MEEGYEDDFTSLLYMHPAQAYADPKSPQPTGSFDRTIEKCQKAIQLHSIKKKPKRNQGKMNDPEYREYVKRDEYNPFIHNAWLLMGKAQFNKGDFLSAAATFLYISRHFTWKPELVAEARIWQARCYIAEGWLYEAEDILTKLNNDGLPPSQSDWFSTVNADYLIRKGNYKQAIPYLKTAIKHASSKRQKIRMTFLLAQLYEKSDDKAMAYQTYNKVKKMSPPYRTEFNARIKQSEVYTGQNIAKEVKSLKRMVGKDRNKDYLDQIYYAIGNLYISRKDTANAIPNYILAAQKSTRNGIEKAISQVTLGNIYFAKRDYVKAQPCYAEAIPSLKETYPDYDLLKRRSEVLDELVVYAQNVELQDSLLTLSSMSEEKRLAVIDKIIADLIKKEKEVAEEQKRQEYLAANQGNNLPAMTGGAKQPTATNINMSGDNSWYFYNPALVSSGKTDFQRKWGSRKLEDDWRRRNKSGFSMSDFAEKTDEEKYGEEQENNDNIGDKQEEAPLDSAAMAAANDPKKREFYLKQIPFTPDEIKTANEIIAEGLYNMGLILNNKLEDFEASIESFNTLDKRYPENPYKLDMYYNMYLMYMRMNNKPMAEVYRAKIRELFPKSDYAVAMADPHYLDNLRRMDMVQDSIYEDTYKNYLDNNNGRVHANYDYMNRKYPLSKLMPKFIFLNSLSYISEKKYDDFKAGLKTLLEKYPNADVSPLATDMLKGLAQGRKIAEGSGNLRGMIWKIQLGDSTALANDTTAAPFVIDNNSPHLFVLVFATDSVSANQLLFNVARHNFTNFMVKDFDLEIMNFNAISMLVVKGFNNLEELKQYRRILEENKQFTLPEEVRPVMISADNFKLLLQGRSFEDYFMFLENNQ